MITRKQLQYVEAWAHKIPMPGEEYSLEVLKQLRECYEIYKTLYQNKEYNLIFSNGEEIDFEILTINLCHMLGIDFKNIRGEFFASSRERIFGISSSDFTSFQLLEMILENAEKVAINDNDNTTKEKFINYYKSEIKSEIFKKLSNFEKFNFAAVDNNYADTSGKMLFVPSNESVCPYFFMGIVPNSNGDGKYVVNTLLAPESPKQFFEGVKASIPTQIIISDNSELKKIVASPEEKMQLINMYLNIISKYNLPNNLDIFEDYYSMLNGAHTRVLK